MHQSPRFNVAYYISILIWSNKFYIIESIYTGREYHFEILEFIYNYWTSSLLICSKLRIIILANSHVYCNNQCRSLLYRLRAQSIIRLGSSAHSKLPYYCCSLNVHVLRLYNSSSLTKMHKHSSSTSASRCLCQSCIFQSAPLSEIFKSSHRWYSSTSTYRNQTSENSFHTQTVFPHHMHVRNILISFFYI